MGRKWTEQHDYFLTTNYETSSLGYLAKALGRTERAVKNRINTLQLSKTKRHDSWSEDELRFLIEHFPIAPRDVLLGNMNRTWTAIYSKAKKLNLKRERREKTIPENGWKEWEIEVLKKDFSHKPIESITNKLKNRSWDAIKIKARTLGLSRDHWYKMPDGINHYYFDKWSSEMAYILGFIAADGNVSKHLYKMGIGLAHKDYDHVIKIRDRIAPKNKVHLREHTASLEVCSKYMCRSLVKLGIPPKKSLILKMPRVPGKYMSHFVRGYFDGDGSISKGGSSNCWSSTILGTKNVLNAINDWISMNGIIDSKNVRPVESIFVLKYSTYDSIKLARWMYKDSTICLERKHERFRQLFRERNAEW